MKYRCVSRAIRSARARHLRLFS